jgi:beta-glucosidase
MTNQPIYKDPTASIEARTEDLLARMSLEEKIGQMTQVEKGSLSPQDVTRHFIGSVLSGGGAAPAENSAPAWAEMVSVFQEGALGTRLGIPLVYGVDAVHGHNSLKGAVIFPHNIGLGASGDPDLVERIGRATAEEVAATGIYWNFAPTIAVPQDIRWGRTFEGYSENTALVARLGAAYTRGLQGEDLSSPLSILATAKHYVGDGGTTWGSSTIRIYSGGEHTIPGAPPEVHFMLDQGVTEVDEETLRAVHLPPYRAAIEAGALCVMASFSSWGGLKMHAQRYLLTEVLKGELGFTGFVVSDWGGVEQVDEDYYQAVVKSVNAGVDMNMVPYDYERFIALLSQAVEKGDVSLERIDDAIRRILQVKFSLGLFERITPDPAHLALVGSVEHRALARRAVAKSLVLLKNEQDTLPLSRETGLIYVGGQAADDIGLQCGGWTIEWLGSSGAITPGTTILQAIRAAVSPTSHVEYEPAGTFEPASQAGERPAAGLGIAVIAEPPYAEGFGDRADLSLSDEDVALIERMRRVSEKLLVILLSGRPLIVTAQLPLMDALVAAWLPGTEGQGVADVLFGDEPFTGKLPYTWPRSMDQIPLSSEDLKKSGPLFPFGFGLNWNRLPR